MTKRAKELEYEVRPPADLVEEIERLNENLNNERDQHLRTLADFKNYRRRIERDGNRLADEGKREIILSLLDVIDDLERALQSTTDGEQTLLESVQIIHQKLIALMETQGIRPFDSTGKLFTPELHEAVTVVEDEVLEPGTVVDDLRRGYLWNDELLRPARVRVAG